MRGSASVARPVYDSEFRRTPLTVALADREEISALRSGRSSLWGRITLYPPIHVSDQDAYLIVPVGPDRPDEPGAKLAELCAAGDRTAVGAVLADSIVARGQIASQERRRTRDRGLVFEISHASTVAALLDRPSGPDAVLRSRAVPELVRALNTLTFLRMPSIARFVTNAGLMRMASSDEYLGPCWEVASLLRGTAGAGDMAEPTFVWSTRSPGGLTVRLALFSEYEESWAYLLPVALR